VELERERRKKGKLLSIDFDLYSIRVDGMRFVTIAEVSTVETAETDL